MAAPASEAWHREPTRLRLRRPAEPPPTPTQMRAKREGEALVERNNYDVYSMTDVEPLPDFKVIVVCDQG